MDALWDAWVARQGEGWGPAWYLAASLARRFGPRCGLTAVPLHREGLGWYGVRLDVPDDAGVPRPYARVTAGGDVERWLNGTPSADVVPIPKEVGSSHEAVAVAVASLGLLRLPERVEPASVDAALVVELLARMGLRCPTGAFTVACEPWGPGLPDEVTVHGPAAQVRLATRRGGVGTDLDPVTAHLSGASFEELTADLLDRLGLGSPHRDTANAYNLAEHRHRYAAWCAARAASRRLRGGTNGAVRLALEASDLPTFVRGPFDRWPTSAPAFDHVHRRWCTQIIEALHGQGVEDATFGRAAKIVAIYLKTLVVCGGHEFAPLARVAHPPIDRVLLRTLVRARVGTPAQRRVWSTTSWTAMNVDAYDDVIVSLRDAGLAEPDFWRVEQWWVGDDEGPS